MGMENNLEGTVVSQEMKNTSITKLSNIETQP